eukprot:6174279-Pleurochrysis_carterae.AAC.3
MSRSSLARPRRGDSQIGAPHRTDHATLSKAGLPDHPAASPRSLQRTPRPRSPCASASKPQHCRWRKKPGARALCISRSACRIWRKAVAASNCLHQQRAQQGESWHLIDQGAACLRASPLEGCCCYISIADFKNAADLTSFDCGERRFQT